MLFADLGEAERRQLLEQHRWVLSAAELLRSLELEESQGLLLCCEGLAQVGSFGVDGDEGVLSLLGPGDIFGQMAVPHGGRRTADATTRRLAVLLDLVCPSVSWRLSPVWPGKRPHGPYARRAGKASWRSWMGAVCTSSIRVPCGGTDCFPDEPVIAWR